MRGIYKITDKVSGKVYIGQSKHIGHRFSEHINSFECGLGINKYHPELQIENLTFEIIELCQEEDLDSREQYWIKYYDSFWNGFNRTMGGQHGLCEEEQELTRQKKHPYRNIEAENQKFINSLKTGPDKYFFNIEKFIEELRPEPNKGYWCYSPWIKENRNIVQLANRLGFNAIELHSINNDNFPMDEEQKRVANIIATTGMVPIGYDFVVVNRAFERGFNIRDARFDQLIVNSTNPVAREQAARMTHPYQRALKVSFPAIPEEYMNRWLDLEECRKLAEELAVVDSNKKVMTWNALKECLEAFGYHYEMKRKRVGGKILRMYMITGDWKENENENDDEDFLELVKAKEKDLQLT